MLAMLEQHGFHAHQVLAEPVGLAQRLFVVVGHGGEERGDLDRVETAENSCENAAGEGRAG